MAIANNVLMRIIRIIDIRRGERERKCNKCLGTDIFCYARMLRLALS